MDRYPHIALLLLICLCLVYGAHVIHLYEPFTYTYADPGWMVSTVMSIVEDHDLDLRNQLKNDPNQAADQTARGQNGQWYPLHEFIMPFLTVPFYLLFGIKGCLIFNVLVSILMMILIFHLCTHHADPASAFAATILTAFPTLFLDYTYSYSLDVFGTFLLICAYWCAVSRKFLLTGFVWALAIYSRLPNLITLIGLAPFLLLVGSSWNRTHTEASGISSRASRYKPLAMALAGALPIAFCFFTSNWIMFGSAFTTSYDRWQHFVNGEAVVVSQRGTFSCSFFDQLPKVLADPKSGLLIGAPLLLVAMAFGIRPFWNKARNECVMGVLLSAALLVVFTKYSRSFPGSIGNRYLMPIVALSTLPLAMAIEGFLGKHVGIAAGFNKRVEKQEGKAEGSRT